MSEPDDLELDRPLTAEEAERARSLTAAQLQRIDECLLSHTPERWRKVAYVIGRTMTDSYREFPGLPDVFYSTRIKHLAARGLIEAAGNLDRMRYSEIRLPEKPAKTK